MGKTAGLVAVAGMVLASAVGPTIAGNNEPLPPLEPSAPVLIQGTDDSQAEFLCSWFPYLRPLCYRAF